MNVFELKKPIWQIIGVNKHKSKFDFNKKLNGLKDGETHQSWGNCKYRNYNYLQLPYFKYLIVIAITSEKIDLIVIVIVRNLYAFFQLVDNYFLITWQLLLKFINLNKK